jgi:hypothetical protein
MSIMPQEQDIIKKDPLEAFHKMKRLLYLFYGEHFLFWNAHPVVMFYNLTFMYIVKFGAVLYKNSELHVSVVTVQNFGKGGKLWQRW